MWNAIFSDPSINELDAYFRDLLHFQPSVFGPIPQRKNFLDQFFKIIPGNQPNSEESFKPLRKVKDWTERFQDQFYESLAQSDVLKLEKLKKIVNSIQEMPFFRVLVKEELLRRGVKEEKISRALEKFDAIIKRIFICRIPGLSDSSMMVSSRQLETEWINKCKERETDEEKYRCRQAVAPICQSKENGSLDILIEEFAKTDNPEIVKAIGESAEPWQILQFIDQAQINENFASKLIFLLGAIPFPSYLLILQSFKPEQYHLLLALNQILQKPVLLYRDADKGSFKIFWNDSEKTNVTAPLDQTDKVRYWFCNSMKTIIQNFCDLLNHIQKDIDNVAGRIRVLAGNKKTTAVEKEMKNVQKLEDDLEEKWRVFLNFKVLVSKLLTARDEKNLMDIETTFALHKGRFNMSDPRVKDALERQNNIALLEKAKHMKLAHEDLIRKLEEKQQIDDEIKSLVLTFDQRYNEVETSLDKGNAVPGGIYDILIAELLEENDLSNDDNAIDIFGAWKLYQIPNYFEIGLLPNVSSDYFKNGQIRGNCNTKLIDKVKRNLALFNIKKVKDWWRADVRVLNKKSLKFFLMKTDVKAKLMEHPFAMDSDASLFNFLGVATLDEYLDIGIIREKEYQKWKNIPVVLFQLAKAFVRELEIGDISNWHNHNIFTLEDFKNFITPEKASETWERIENQRPSLLLELQNTYARLLAEKLANHERDVKESENRA